MQRRAAVCVFVALASADHVGNVIECRENRRDAEGGETLRRLPSNPSSA